jgi:hypothetical protein
LIAHVLDMFKELRVSIGLEYIVPQVNIFPVLLGLITYKTIALIVQQEKWETGKRGALENLPHNVLIVMQANIVLIMGCLLVFLVTWETTVRLGRVQSRTALLGTTAPTLRCVSCARLGITVRRGRQCRARVRLVSTARMRQCSCSVQKQRPLLRIQRRAKR